MAPTSPKRHYRIRAKRRVTRRNQNEFDDRRACHVCKHNTKYFCLHYRWYLCNELPLNSKYQDGKMYPPYSCVRVPILTADGSVEQDADWMVVFEEEYGELSCWNIAHKYCWKNI